MEAGVDGGAGSGNSTAEVQVDVHEFYGDEDNLHDECDDGEESEDVEYGDWRKPVALPRDVSVCRQCGKVFNVLRFRDLLQVCKAVAGSLSAVERSVDIALELINIEEVTVYGGDLENPVLKEAIVHPSKYNTHMFKRGCEKRPKRGETMGKNFIEPLKEAIETLLRDGNEDKGKKLSAARMQEILILRHPMRYDIPSIHHITSFVQSVLCKMKKNGKIRQSIGQEPAGRGLLVAQTATITRSTLTKTGVGDVCSMSADPELVPDETTRATPETSIGATSGRRGMAQKYREYGLLRYNKRCESHEKSHVETPRCGSWSAVGLPPYHADKQ